MNCLWSFFHFHFFFYWEIEGVYVYMHEGCVNGFRCLMKRRGEFIGWWIFMLMISFMKRREVIFLREKIIKFLHLWWRCWMKNENCLCPISFLHTPTITYVSLMEWWVSMPSTIGMWTIKIIGRDIYGQPNTHTHTCQIGIEIFFFFLIKTWLKMFKIKGFTN